MNLSYSHEIRHRFWFQIFQTVDLNGKQFPARFEIQNLQHRARTYCRSFKANPLPQATRHSRFFMRDGFWVWYLIQNRVCDQDGCETHSAPEPKQYSAPSLWKHSPSHSGTISSFQSALIIKKLKIIKLTSCARSAPRVFCFRALSETFNNRSKSARRASPIAILKTQ